MTIERIKEIQAETAYPDSRSVQQALIKVWNECEQNNLNKYEVSGDASDFEQDLFVLINSYCKNGLEKPDLVRKMEWVTGSCKMS